jgi:hypothetical protein
VSFRVTLVAIIVFELQPTVVARKQMIRVRVFLVVPQIAFSFARVRASFDVTFEQTLVRVIFYVPPQQAFGGKIFSTHIALKWFRTFMMYIFSVFLQLVTILEQAELAVPAKTPVDSRRLSIVVYQVILEAVKFYYLTA